uniref:Putative terminase n=1 Tax=viral metagenome TaxID=1070528 RepID=A0A6M3J8J7_9ZZZZ
METDNLKIADAIIERLGQFKSHTMAHEFLNSKANTRVVITGNQAGKTRVSMHDLALRILEMHPVSERNRIDAPIRCISKSLPKNEEDEENQQYVEFMKIFPYELIEKNINFIVKHMKVRSPSGKNHKIEFMSKKQEIDAFMSVQRQTIYQDEEIDKLKWDENQMRLLSTDGDTVLALTPVRGLDWTYDQIWCRAHRIYRSPTLCNVFKFPPLEEFKDRDTDIDIFCWATDDNPILSPAAVKRIFDEFDERIDSDELAMRRYGVFRQVSGRIYKEFDMGVHVISHDDYWDAKQFQQYWHYRMVDYHQAKPWYASWVAVTPQHEWFVWNELMDRMDTDAMREVIKEKSLVPEYHMNNRMTLFDPLAKEEQSNTGESMFDHISKGEKGLRMCEVADTKNQQGRNNIMRRLRNALICEVPFNNENNGKSKIENDPRHEGYLPTLWFFETCRGHIEHFRNWRTIEYKQEHTKAQKDEKAIMQRWSDYCRNLEFLGAQNPVYYAQAQQEYSGRTFFHRENRNVANG